MMSSLSFLLLLDVIFNKTSQPERVGTFEALRMLVGTRVVVVMVVLVLVFWVLAVVRMVVKRWTRCAAPIGGASVFHDGLRPRRVAVGLQAGPSFSGPFAARRPLRSSPRAHLCATAISERGIFRNVVIGQ